MRSVKGLFIACFMCFIAVVGLTTVNNKNEKSMTEGRELRQFPEIEYARLAQTEYLSSITNAFSDQITGREKMISQYNDLMVNVLGQKWVGSIALGKEKQLFQEPEIIADEKAYEKEVIRCAEVINREAAKVAETGASFVYINYPRKDVAEKKYLPDFYPDSAKDYDKLISVMKSHLSDDVVFIDACELFRDGEKYYYSNDHHVNFKGQMKIYHELMSLVKEKFPDVRVYRESDYRTKKVAVDGSFNRRIGYAVSPEKEVLRVEPVNFPPYQRQKSKAPVFGKGKTYASAFMGGDYADTVVTTGETHPKDTAAKGTDEEEKGVIPTIFISGSSYTNSLEALCVGSFSSMHSVDYRSNDSGKTVADFAGEEKPDYVVYIPNQSDRHFSLETFKLHLGL